MKLERRLAALLDLAMCGFMNGVQFRHRLNGESLAALEAYMHRCAALTPADFYAVPPGAADPPEGGATLDWDSPVRSAFPENNRAHADLFPSPAGWSAPTVILLHALMSASDLGYRRIAIRLNEMGWNACFVHLPFHYSRRPRGCLNGELAITADLVRTGETLRQGVLELRQLMAWLRARGCREFGLMATSYGGWIGSLLSFVEPDFRFLALMTPIVNVRHAIWESPAASRMRAELRRCGVAASMVDRHDHLTSPMHNVPLCGPERVVLVAGTHDQIARPADIEALHRKWDGSHFLTVEQGHFGYRILPGTMRALVRRGLLARV